ncbi:MAG: PilZ domain-containing protein [Candidatus Acidiferrales bacterium]
MTEDAPRRGLRHPFRTEVEIGWGAEVLKAVSRDIGESGMFIETDRPLWLRAEFTARMNVGELIEVDCIVRRIEPGRGMAVEFKDLPDAEREQIGILIGKLSDG